MRLVETTSPALDYWKDRSLSKNDEGSDIWGQEERLRNHYYYPHRDRVGSSLVDAVEQYTSHSFPLNNKLMHGKIEGVEDYWQGDPEKGGESDYDWHGHFDDIHDRLHGFMKKMPEAPEEIHSFAGIGKLHADALSSTPEGGIHEAKSWISTSIDPSESEGFNKVNHIAHFRIPKGSKVGAYVDGYSTNDGEKEFLISHGTRWRKTGQSQIGKFTIHHLEPEQ